MLPTSVATSPFPRSDISNHATEPCVVEASWYRADLTTPRISWAMFARQTVLAQMPFFTVRSIPEEVYSIPAKASQHHIEAQSAQVATSKRLSDRAAKIPELDADDEMTQVGLDTSHTRYAKTPRALNRQRQRRIPPYHHKQGELEAKVLGDHTSVPVVPIWNSWSNAYTINNQHRGHSKSWQHKTEQFGHDPHGEDNAWLGDDEGGQGESSNYVTNHRQLLSQPKHKTVLAKLLVDSEDNLAGRDASDERIVRWLNDIPEDVHETPTVFKQNLNEVEGDEESMFNVEGLWKEGID